MNISAEHMAIVSTIINLAAGCIERCGAVARAALSIDRAEGRG
jgi:hypothetical protein